MNNKHTFTKEMIERQEKFISENTIEIIPTSNIYLKSRIHKNAKENIQWKINKLKTKELTELTGTLIVKKEQKGFSLVTGYSTYMMARALNISDLKCVVIKQTRKQFIDSVVKQKPQKEKKNTILLSEIIIPWIFKKSMPSPLKLDVCRDYYNSTGYLDREIVITKYNKLRDGYVGYLIAQELGFTEVEFRYTTKKDYEDKALRKAEKKFLHEERMKAIS